MTDGSHDPLRRPFDRALDVPPHLRKGPGPRIGPYELRQQIGAGGFGAVRLAGPTAHVEREVLEFGTDTVPLAARLERERQARARAGGAGSAARRDRAERLVGVP